jgi:hypothetical protein
MKGNDMDDDQGLQFHQTVSAEQEWLEDEEAQREYREWLQNLERGRMYFLTRKEYKNEMDR